MSLRFGEQLNHALSNNQMTATVANELADRQRTVAPETSRRCSKRRCGYARRRLDTSPSVETGIFRADYAGGTPARREPECMMLFTTSIECAAVAGLRDQLFGRTT